MRLIKRVAFVCSVIGPGYANASVLPSGAERQSVIQLNKRAENDSSVPAPLVVSPSRRWDGTDGLWSAFDVQLGSQSLRLLPSTSSSVTWAITSVKDCGNRTSAACVDWHGGIFDSRKSSTWEPLANASLEAFDSNVQATLGLDRVSLSGPNGAAVVIDKAVVAGTEVTDSVSMGALGLNPRPMGVPGSGKTPQAGLIQEMKDRNLIPSLSWAYTAGAGYYLGESYGSLVLGGFDAARSQKQATSDPQLTFPIAQDPARDLVVGISSIKYSGTTELLDSENGTFALIDSSTPFFRFPETVCKAFEDAFGLTWNDQKELYTLNVSQHRDLAKLDPQVTFTLSPTLPATAANKTVSITLPYAAFDLTATSADGTETLYFPLKRAANESQISLGRAFLQEAYLIADYERNELAVWPVNWGWTPATAKVEPVTAVITNTSKTSDPTPVHATLGKAAIAGAAVGSSAGVIALALFFILRRHHRSSKKTSTQELSSDSDHELHAAHRFEATEGVKFELNGIARPHEADVKTMAYEADGRPVIHELDAGGVVVGHVPEIRLTSASVQSTLDADGKQKYGIGERGRGGRDDDVQELEREEPGELTLRRQDAMSFGDFLKKTLGTHR